MVPVNLPPPFPNIRLPTIPDDLQIVLEAHLYVERALSERLMPSEYHSDDPHTLTRLLLLFPKS